MTDQESDAPNVVVPREHQSAPKEHWIEPVMRRAAEDIESGQFKPELAEDDYFYYGPEQLLAMHPAMGEALERLKTEIDRAKNGQEYLEKAEMLHEINERLQAGNKWDGQGRWIGKENEEMRQGEILEPLEFMRRLWAVIGDGRVEICRYAVMGRVALLVNDPDAAAKRLLMLPPQYQPPVDLRGKVQVATLQWPYSTEWMVMRFNAYGVPTAAKYLGWRTALLSLISYGIITEREAHRAFPVKQNEASLWYRAQLYQFRNGGRKDA